MENEMGCVHSISRMSSRGPADELVLAEEETPESPSRVQQRHEVDLTDGQPGGDHATEGSDSEHSGEDGHTDAANRDLEMSIVNRLARLNENMFQGEYHNIPCGQGFGAYRPSTGGIPLILPLEQTTPYPYKKLQHGQIRLLTIHPPYKFPGGSNLLCSLSTLDLFEERSGTPGQTLLNACRPEYGAVSYAWGPEKPSVRLRCNEAVRVLDQGTWVTGYSNYSNESVLVTKSVEEVLLRLRSETAPVHVWIDQVCINQADNDEKSAQVQAMGLIYLMAADVKIWLGDSDEDTDRAFSCLRRIAASMATAAAQSPPGEETPSDMLASHPWNLDPDSPWYIPVQEWEALRELFIGRSWFRRCWVLQEAVLAGAATALCGSFSLPWPTVEAACEAIISRGLYTGPWFDPQRDPSFAIANVREMAGRRAAHRKGDDPLGLLLLERLLMDTRGLEASDPVDVVYSKYGVCRNSRPLPPPDYRLGVRDVYTQTALYWLYNWRHNLDMLSEVQAARVGHGLPSWVPDWSVPAIAVRLSSVRTDGGFDATGHDSRLFEPVVTLPSIPESGAIGDGPLLLTVRGVVLMTISMIQEPSATGNIILCPMTDPYPTTGETYRDVCNFLLKPAPGGGRYRHHERAPKARGFWGYKEEWEGEAASAAAGAAATQFRVLSDSRPPMENLVREAVRPSTLKTGRRVFTSECGFMGLVPAYTEARVDEKKEVVYEGGAARGDVICLLFGSRIPFVLRRVGKGDGSGRWRLIGECFVYGVMHGEAVEDIPGSRVEDFAIQ